MVESNFPRMVASESNGARRQAEISRCRSAAVSRFSSRGIALKWSEVCFVPRPSHCAGAVLGFGGERDADDASVAGFGRDNFQIAVMRLDNLPAHGEAQTQTHIARREERRGGALHRLWREARAVLHDAQCGFGSG